ncbi:unnamed protein product [Hymenolepis diminuta]|uniref:Uncharacterized protein n=1 Tax=Hymenolepis diminuta TaxID=6216 RepID=A0A564Z360_HYMDI|nr:unnamed protein product [Hymenolepis diminuta]
MKRDDDREVVDSSEITSGHLGHLSLRTRSERPLGDPAKSNCRVKVSLCERQQFCISLSLHFKQ